MALIKEKITNTGTTGNYWKITLMIYDRITNICKVEVSLFKDATASANKLQPMIKKSYSISMTKEEFSDNPVATLYIKIKEIANAEPIILSMFMSQDEDLKNAEDA